MLAFLWKSVYTYFAMRVEDVTAVANEIGGRCTAVRVRMVSRVVTSIFDQALKPFGVSTGQLNHLVVLARKGPISSSGVATTLFLEPSTASRNLDRMRLKGWVDSVSLPKADRRSHGWSLTPKGRRLLIEIHPVWKEAQDQVEKRIGPRLSSALSTVVPGRAI